MSESPHGTKDTYPAVPVDHVRFREEHVRGIPLPVDPPTEHRREGHAEYIKVRLVIT